MKGFLVFVGAALCLTGIVIIANFWFGPQEGEIIALLQPAFIGTISFVGGLIPLSFGLAMHSKSNDGDE